jgi:hypothetical protein
MRQRSIFRMAGQKNGGTEAKMWNLFGAGRESTPSGDCGGQVIPPTSDDVTEWLHELSLRWRVKAPEYRTVAVGEKCCPQERPSRPADSLNQLAE